VDAVVDLPQPDAAGTGSSVKGTHGHASPTSNPPAAVRERHRRLEPDAGRHRRTASTASSPSAAAPAPAPPATATSTPGRRHDDLPPPRGRAGDAGQRGRRTAAEQPPVLPDQGLAALDGLVVTLPNAGMTGIVVIGAGQAGVQAAEALRAGGYTEPITLLGDEPHRPLPPAAAVQGLAGRRGRRRAAGDARARHAGAQGHHAAHRRARVAAIDRGARSRAPGRRQQRCPTSGLVLATGSRPRR
jgi:hypothetical protein